MKKLEFQLKALAKLRHAKRVWEGVENEKRNTQSIRLSKNVTENCAVYLKQWPYRGLGHGTEYEDSKAFMSACFLGDSVYVQKALETKPKLFMKNPSVLHKVCARGHFATFVALLPYCSERIVNFRDCLYGNTTPIIELARSKCGDVRWRLEMFKLLVEKGADITLQDSSGNTCLHWAVKTQELAIVRHIFENTDVSVYAANIENLKKHKPLNEAFRCLKTKNLYIQKTIFNILKDVQKGSNLRKKVQDNKRRRKNFDRMKKQLLADEISFATQNSLDELHRTQRICKHLHESAELVRSQDEENFVNAAIKKGCEKFKPSPNELKKLTRTISDDVKLQIKMGTFVGNKPSNITAYAKSKASQLILKRKHKEIRSKAVTKFRMNNPPLNLGLSVKVFL